MCSKSLPIYTWTFGNLSERQDNEIAYEIQEQLVRQAELQRRQEEKDAVRNMQTHIQTFLPIQAQRWSHPAINDLTFGIDVLYWVGHAT